MASFLRYCSLLVTVSFCLLAVPVRGQEPRLVTSSPFHMILRPMSKELNYVSLKTLEKAAATTIIRNDASGQFMDMDVAVQSVDYISEGNSTLPPAEEPYARLRFFGLGISRAMSSNGTTMIDVALQSQLNQLVAQSFLDGVNGYFLRLIQMDPILNEAQSVIVELVTPGGSDEPSGGEEGDPKSAGLSLVDIVLITVSVLILLGILYMVVEHVKDRGYIENERLRVTNQRDNSFDEYLVQAEQGAAESLPTPTPNSSLKVLSKAEESESEEDDTPSTPSTTDSVAEELPNTPERSVRIKTTTISAADPDVLLAKPDHPTFPENFEDSSKWFHPAHTKPRRLRKISHPPVSVIAEGDEEEEESMDGVYEDNSSDDDSDPFHVDVSAVSSVDDTTKSVASAASTVTEWMKTIRVVAPDITEQISEDMTESLPDEEKCGWSSGSSSSMLTSSSEDLSMASSSLIHSQSSKLEEEDLDSISLEKSLASSCAECRQTKRKIEEV